MRVEFLSFLVCLAHAFTCPPKSSEIQDTFIFHRNSSDFQSAEFVFVADIHRFSTDITIQNADAIRCGKALWLFEGRKAMLPCPCEFSDGKRLPSTVKNEDCLGWDEEPENSKLRTRTLVKPLVDECDVSVSGKRIPQSVEALLRTNGQSACQAFINPAFRGMDVFPFTFHRG